MDFWNGDTHHSRLRRAQRGISAAQVQGVQRFGRKTRQPGGKIVFYVGKRDLAKLREAGEDVDLYANLAAVFSRDGFLITTFRSANFRRVRMYGVSRRGRR